MTSWKVFVYIVLLVAVHHCTPHMSSIPRSHRLIRSPFGWPDWNVMKKEFLETGLVLKKEMTKVRSHIDSKAGRMIDVIKVAINDFKASPKAALPFSNYPNSDTEEENYCEYKPEPKTPTFEGLNLSLSDRKCRQYAWKIGRIESSFERDKKCATQSQKKGIYFILGGKIAYPGEFPHMVAIGWKASTGKLAYKCGGTLISPKFVLSAGHCISVPFKDVTDREPKVVRLGDRNTEDADVIAIKRIIRHPSFRPPKKYFDIALFEMQKEAEFTQQVHPACLWTWRGWEVNENQGIISGWGVVKYGASNTSVDLRKATVDILDIQQCQPLLRSSENKYWEGFAEHQLCAGILAGGVDSCQGDSGGPLQIPCRGVKGLYTVLGVTSFGIRCGLPNSPGIYTKVSSFIDWIEATVWPGE